jgi:hypothetical protein
MTQGKNNQTIYFFMTSTKSFIIFSLYIRYVSSLQIHGSISYRSKAIIKNLRIQGRGSIMMPATLSKMKYFLLLGENHSVDTIAIHYPSFIKAHLL